MKKREKHIGKRRWIQILSAVFFNSYLKGFAEGNIFQGGSKALCVPVLNCYSCPGALGSCPIGALQSVASSRRFHFSFYVLGFLALVGLVLGRIVCAFLCPFGLVQELLYRLPLKKLQMPQRVDKALRYLKYGILVFSVLLFPSLLVNELGLGETWFCKYLCPAGTLGAGIPLLISDESLRASVSWLFGWKTCLLFIVLVASSLVHRPFCRYLCPLGAFYGLFHRHTLFQMTLDKEKCISCGKCEAVCPMGVECMAKIQTAECIGCGECSKVCPSHAIHRDFLFKKENQWEKNQESASFLLHPKEEAGEGFDKTW